ncbi:MAG: TetR/AcrR family transcriptional regulator [Acidobacteriota bacterium]|nr:TetR/AcrR family transcriptional regulator [Acidobacteriota bacterium]
MIPTSTDRGDKRPRLVRAAGDVFAEKGYASTRVADIADRAGIGKGTVYEYFSSKEELLFAVFESINEDITLRMNAVLDDDEPTQEQLFNLLRLGAEVITEQRDLQPVVLDFWAASRGGGFEEMYRESVVASYTLYRKLIADFIRGGQKLERFRSDVDADALAAMLVATVDGLGIQLYFDQSIDPRRITEQFAHLLYESLSMEST